MAKTALTISVTGMVPGKKAAQRRRIAIEVAADSTRVGNALSGALDGAANPAVPSGGTEPANGKRDRHGHLYCGRAAESASLPRPSLS